MDSHEEFLWRCYYPAQFQKRTAAKAAPAISTHVFRPDGSMLLLRKADLELIKTLFTPVEKSTR